MVLLGAYDHSTPRSAKAAVARWVLAVAMLLAAAVLLALQVHPWGGVLVLAAGVVAALAAAANPGSRPFAFTAWVLAFAASACFFPGVYTWTWHQWQPRQAIVPLVQVIMFGMGVTLTLDDFVRVLRMPLGVFAGVVCQFSIMPLVAWIAARAFGLEGEVAAGLILIGSCPGGVASNVIAYIARANVALSVSMTACSTLLSPLVTPLAMNYLAGQYVPIAVGPMMLSIVSMILAPVLLGLLANYLAPGLVRRAARWLPTLAMLAICVIIAITIALAHDDLQTVGLFLLAASACHNLTGYLLGYGGARLMGLDPRDCRTVALEVGIQNGGMATGLAMNVLKSPAAALGAAVFGPLSAVTSSMLASYWHARPVPPADSAV